MKSNFKIAGAIIVLLMATTLFYSCKKNSTNTVSDAEAASIVTSATSNSSGGLAYDITNAVSSTAQYGKKGGINRIQLAACNTPESNPINWSFGNSGYSFSYNGYSNYELLCANGSSPSSFTLSDGYNGQFSYGTTFSGSASDTSNWTITQLDSSFASYVFNGSFDRNGNYKETSGSKTFSYTYTINYKVTNVNVDKLSQEITSGTAQLTVTASVNGGSTYTGNGSIVFNNNNTATLTIGSSTTTISD